MITFYLILLLTNYQFIPSGGWVVLLVHFNAPLNDKSRKLGGAEKWRVVVLLLLLLLLS